MKLFKKLCQFSGAVLALSSIATISCANEGSENSESIQNIISTEGLLTKGSLDGAISPRAKFFRNGVIYGFVFNDKNADGRRNFRERGLADVTVYLDTNDNGIRDADEESTRTRRSGIYAFIGLPPGDYIVRQELEFGWRNVSGGEGENAMLQTVSAKPSDDESAVPFIIGGDEVEIEEYPFMAALTLDFGFPFQFCGGVIISDRWIATAAHCLDGLLEQDIPFLKALVGTNNVFDGSGEFLDVKSFSLHPDFTPLPPGLPTGPVSTEAGYDIALIELAQPVDLAASGLRSVSMVNQDNSALAEDGVLATTVGWGVSNISSNLLQDVHVPIFDSQQCQTTYENVFGSINFDTQICAGAPEGGIDACQGDSGGPLLVRDFDAKEWKVAGFTSYGLGCAFPGFPGVWSRASSLSDWAEANATEASRVYRVALEAGEFKRATFGNASTLYESEIPIEPRWQLVNPVLSGNEDSGFVFDFRIIDEAPKERNFSCSADLDGMFSLPGSNFDCISGDNTVALPLLDLDDGIFFPEFSASFGDTTFNRDLAEIVNGDLEENSVSGSITSEDVLDSDFVNPDPEISRSYYIDYYDLSGVVGDQPRIIRVTSNDFTSFNTIYNRDIRENDSTPFASIIDTFAPPVGEEVVAERLFVAEPGIDYVLGVSTLGELETGSYTITVVNGGIAEETILSVPELERRRVKREEFSDERLNQLFKWRLKNR